MSAATWLSGVMLLGGQLAGSSVVVPASLQAQAGIPGWLELGPHAAGRLTAIATQDGHSLWVGSEGGGVWKSVDGGNTFVWPGNAGLTDFTVLDLQFDARQPGRLYLRTWNGFWVSTDGAASWRRTLRTSHGDGDTPMPIATRPNPNYFTFRYDYLPRPFAQMPLASGGNLLFTALPCEGLEYSIDAGESWQRIWPFAGNENNWDNCIDSIAADAATGKVYVLPQGYDMFAPDRVYRTTAGFTSGGPPSPLLWQQVSNGLPTGPSVYTAPFDLAWGGRADRILLATYAEADPLKLRVYSFDGASWSPRINHDTVNCISSGSPSRALTWGGQGDDLFLDGINLASSPSGGASWSCPPQQGSEHVDVRGIFANAALGRVWTVRDGADLGEAGAIASYPWSPGGALGPAAVSNAAGLSTWLSYTVAVGGAGFDRIFTGAQDVYSACTDNGGASWNRLNTAETAALAFAPSDPSVLYQLASSGEGLVRFDHVGAGSSCAAGTASGYDYRTILSSPHALAIDPRDAQRFFVVSGSEIAYSTDGGPTSHFTYIPEPPPPFGDFCQLLPGNGLVGSCAYPTSVYVDDAGTLYAGTAFVHHVTSNRDAYLPEGGVYRCTDTSHYCDGTAGAGTWELWGLNKAPNFDPPAAITAIAAKNVGALRFSFLATSDGLYRRVDNGIWRPVSPNPPGYLYSDVMIDPSCPSRVYAALGFAVDSRSRGGVYFSPSSGAPGTWQHLTAGVDLDNVPVSQVAVSARNPTKVYASTYGRGVWGYDWATRLPACVTTPPPCVAGDTTLCLGDGRFRVQVTDVTPDGSNHVGHAVPLTGDTGYFWFFSPSNVEMVLKVLDACGVNGQYWVYAGGLTDTQVSVTVTDTLTGELTSFVNPQGVAFVPYGNTSAMDCTGTVAAAAAVTASGVDSRAPVTVAWSGAASPRSTPPAMDQTEAGAVAPCTADDTHLCLNAGRFRVSTTWQANGQSGSGHVVQLTPDTGYFWFFNSSNVELVLKVLDACAFNQRFWVYAGGLTDVQVTTTVVDTHTGRVNTYHNPAGVPFAPITDSSAFASCP